MARGWGDVGFRRARREMRRVVRRSIFLRGGLLGGGDGGVYMMVGG